MSALNDLCPPCPHNAWDNVRMRRDLATLSCRVCGIEFKTRGLIEVACLDFRENGECPLGPSCPYLHVYRRKTDSRRSSLHDELNNQQQRDDVLHSVALAVIRERGPGRVRCSTIAQDIYAHVEARRCSNDIVVGSDVNSTKNPPPAFEDSSASFSQGLSSIRCSSPTNSICSATSSILPSPSGAHQPQSSHQHQPSLLKSSLLPVTGHFVPIQRAISTSEKR